MKIHARIDSWLSRRSRMSILFVSLLLTVACGVVDYWVLPPLSFALFYIGPIALAAWYGGSRPGLAVGLAAALAWYIADVFDEGSYVFAWVPVWNMLIQLGFFVIIAFLLGALRARLLFEESLAATDALTGLANRRRFVEHVGNELERMRRYAQPFTIAYLDLDNFKAVNDTQGHDAGDEVLRQVATALRTHMRQSDTAARLGGDEFAALFPGADYNAATLILEKIQDELRRAMAVDAVPVTFSIGAVTFQHSVANTRDAVKIVDDLMYLVKRAGKNDLSHKVWRG